MKELIKKIILNFDEFRKREFIDRVIDIPMDTRKIITIIGPRRSGKSTVMFQLMRDLMKKYKVKQHQIVYLNFEDERLEMDVTKFDWIIQAYTELYPQEDLRNVYFFFDEIQNIPGWEKFVRRLYDSISKNIFLTGSNAKFLSVEISTSLRGRCLNYEVLPLSFYEFLLFKGLKVDTDRDMYKLQKHALIKNYFMEYLMYGGFPEIVDFPEKLKIKILQEYFNVMIFRDIAERYKIKDLSLLKFFIKRIFESISKPLSINKIYNELKSRGYKISKNDLYDYVDMVYTGYLTKYIFNQNQSVNKREMSKKYYAIDMGLVSAVSADLNIKNKLLENLMMLEIYRHLETTEKIMYYHSPTKECDFVVDQKIPVQVCVEFMNEETQKREINGLMEAMKYFKSKTGYIITVDKDDHTLKTLSDKIKVLSAYEFILNVNKYL
ncbi:MAG: ATPase [Bacteroidia bacterium]|nr:MAG: ATPase [Bacteroidia bacterium]